VKIALLGDFGTGDWGSPTNPAASTKIRKLVAELRPEITIHLGDVYYSGRVSAEQGNLVGIWPAGSLGSVALNSNHEMYPGGVPYFSEAFAADAFKMQQQNSFFALENDHWMIVALDSAYHADPYSLYMDGNIDELQLHFLRQCAESGKKLLIITHHNGLSEDGVQQTQLWIQVGAALPQGVIPAFWYWGHVHAGVVYQPEAGTGVACRCIGHSALPWGLATELANNRRIAWFESRSANDPEDPVRVLNGFALLSFNGPQVSEAIYDENGGVAWQS
jgi:hypothetical protein